MDAEPMTIKDPSGYARPDCTRSTRRKTLTTGQIASICEVSAVTVAKWIDSGDLKGHLVPGTRFRRVFHQDLVIFFRDRGIDSAFLNIDKEKHPQLGIVDELLGSLHRAPVQKKSESDKEFIERYRIWFALDRHTAIAQGLAENTSEQDMPASELQPSLKE